MHKVLIAPTTFSLYNDQPMDLLKKNGFDIIKNEWGQKLSASQLVDLCRDCNAVIAGTEIYNKVVLNQLSDLKVISRLGVGMDNIDLEVVRQKNIKIYKTTTTPAPAVAELVLGLMINLARNISTSDKSLKNGIWKKEMGCLIQGKTLGIIGLGTIGKNLVKLVKGLNFKILANDLFHDDKFAKEYEVNYCDIDTLLAQSDMISIHLNLTTETYDLINKERIALLNPECILINTSRGEIIDEAALYIALKERKILGAGLDVFNKEPYSGILTTLDNVVLTPHIGSYARELRIQMEIETEENLIRGLNEL